MFSTLKVHGSWNGGRPLAVCTCSGGEQGVSIKFHKEFKPDQSISVNRVEVVQASIQLPNITACCIGSVLKDEGDPRTVRQEEGDVAFTAAVIPLRCHLSNQRSVAKVKDIGYDPVKGKSTLVVGR